MPPPIKKNHGSKIQFRPLLKSYQKFCIFIILKEYMIYFIPNTVKVYNCTHSVILIYDVEQYLLVFEFSNIINNIVTYAYWISIKK